MIFLYLFYVVFSTALCIVAFLLAQAGSIQKFKETYGRRCKRSSHLPIITRHGDIVNSLEDLDVQLEVLKSQLTDKQNLLEESKGRVASASHNLQKLHDTSCEVKKYYIKLKAEISKSDKDCKELQKQIEEYKKTQNKLRDEVNANIKYYNNLISDIDAESCTKQEFEMLTKLPIEECEKFMEESAPARKWKVRCATRNSDNVKRQIDAFRKQGIIQMDSLGNQ